MSYKATLSTELISLATKSLEPLTTFNKSGSPIIQQMFEVKSPIMHAYMHLTSYIPVHDPLQMFARKLRITFSEGAAIELHNPSDLPAILEYGKSLCDLSLSTLEWQTRYGNPNAIMGHWIDQILSTCKPFVDDVNVSVRETYDDETGMRYEETMIDTATDYRNPIEINVFLHRKDIPMNETLPYAFPIPVNVLTLTKSGLCMISVARPSDIAKAFECFDKLSDCAMTTNEKIAESGSK